METSYAHECCRLRGSLGKTPERSVATGILQNQFDFDPGIKIGGDSRLRESLL